jgi:hypothetical protein
MIINEHEHSHGGIHTDMFVLLSDTRNVCKI